MKAYFISFEGIEGVGKSTAIKWVMAYLANLNIDFVVNREPGGTEISEDIRQVLLQHHPELMSLETELLLMFACRSQNVSQVVKPALQTGKWVISDRFTDASYAYQGYGRGMALEKIASLAQWVHGDLKPDITFLLDAPVDIGFERLKKRRNKDRIESEDLGFFERVRQGYLTLAKNEPNRFRLVQADRPLAEVQQQLLKELNKLIT
ncbi:MAG: dTMP kinase [Proteobacteria bacterium]|nr:dTMP kinase [Pseudomonadota bacterium]